MSSDDDPARAADDTAQRALAVAGIGLVRIDVATGRVALDATCHEVLGVAPAADDRVLLLDTVHPDDRAAVRAQCEAAVRGAAQAACDFRLVESVGIPRRARLQWLPACADGASPTVTGLLRALAGPRDDPSALAAKPGLEPPGRAQSAFLARIGHDLRTPLNAILGFCDLLQHSDRHPLPGEPAEQVAHIAVAGRQLRRMVDGLVDLARIDLGQLKVRPGRADLGDVAAAAWREADAPALRRRVSLAPFEPRPAAVAADAARLRQIVDALVDNAVRYSRSGGDAALVMGARDGGFELAVHDRGEGLTAVQFAAACEPFAARGPEAGHRSHGMGFGLPLAAHLARAMGGRLAVDGRPGGGSVLRLWLPAAADQAPPG